MLMSLNDHDVNNIWNEWIRDDDTSRFSCRSMSIKRLIFDTTQAGTVAREETVSIDRLVEEALIREAMNTWKGEMDREEAKRGKGGNKLRTYRRFKSEVYMEPYLLHIVDERKRALMFKFRSGISPLRIETGRYEASRYGQHGLPVHERICLCCANGVEDEEHLLCMCPAYSSVRAKLFQTCSSFNASLGDSNSSQYIHINTPSQVFVDLMKACDVNIVNSLANFMWDAFKIREQRLKELNG